MHTRVCFLRHTCVQLLFIWDRHLVFLTKFLVPLTVSGCLSVCLSRSEEFSPLNYWFSAHLTDLMHHCGKLESRSVE